MSRDTNLKHLNNNLAYTKNNEKGRSPWKHCSLPWHCPIGTCRL